MSRIKNLIKESGISTRWLFDHIKPNYSQRTFYNYIENDFSYDDKVREEVIKIVKAYNKFLNEIK